MNARHVTRTLVVALIVAMLGGAYVIVARSNSAANGAQQVTPSGLFH